MLPLWSRKVSGLFTLLLTTSTSFVATHSIGSTTVNRLSRIAVAEDGLATSRLETAGATHLRRGKRYYPFLSSPAEVLTTNPGLLVRSLRQHK